MEDALATMLREGESFSSGPCACGHKPPLDMAVNIDDASDANMVTGVAVHCDVDASDPTEDN